MNLAELFQTPISRGLVQYVRGPMDVPVSDLCVDSRRVTPGSLFIAQKGTNQDSHLYLAQAAEAGSVAFLVESTDHVPQGFKGAVLLTSQSRRVVGDIAEKWNDFPSDHLFCVGITGTNGKTTTSHMVEWILEPHAPCAVIGTINHHLGKRVWPTQLTTPGPVELHSRLQEFLKAGAKSVSMEVSSHALSQKRADQIQFDVAVFTNLTRDHMDFHKSFSDYFAAKARLFRELLPNSRKKQKGAVLNADDDHGLQLAQEMRTRGISLLTFGAHKDADLRYEIRREGLDGTEFVCHHLKTKLSLFFPQPCRHNVQNALAAVAVGVFYGISLAEALERMSQFPGVPGRLEPVNNRRGLHIFIDYAHTDDALKSVLGSLRQLEKRSSSKPLRVLTVFGCGGDRDKGKRPLMARAALEHSDLVVVTSDNPRNEDPQQIIEDIVGGLPTELLKKTKTIVDRREAIRYALEVSQPGDVIVIAGKGHEDYQIIGKERIPFSDRQVVSSLL